MIDMGEPNWPSGDPAAIVRWFEAGGKEDLGRNYNSWKALIYTCTSSIWYSANSFAERKGFRDAALAVAEAGRSMGVISVADYTEHVVYTRMSYIRNSGEERAWQESEMEAVSTIFLDWIKIDVTGARELMASLPELPADWRELPMESRRQLLRPWLRNVRPLRDAKGILGLMAYSREYIRGERSEEILAWLDMIPELP
jgi:hypothetical protein